MHAPASFDYAILRVVPRVERQEFMNAGVLVFCLEKRYLGARIRLDRDRLKALWPDVDADLVSRHLEAVERICAGDPTARPIALLPAGTLPLACFAAQHNHSAIAGAYRPLRRDRPIA